MKKRIEIITLTIVLIILVTLFIIFLMKVYKTNHKDTEYNKVNDNKTYLQKRDYHVSKVPHLKTIEVEEPHIKNIDEYLKAIHFNGAVTVLENGKLKLNKGYGYQNFQHKTKNSPNTMYLIGSAQKFTTGLILKKLENENKVNINDPVTKYLPWFKTTKNITLKDLMLHRSGLYKFEASPKTKSLDGAVHAIQARGIDEKFYHKHLYNDANYLVLAQVIEVVTHKPYAANYYDDLAQPFSLQHSAFFNEKPYKKYMAIGYKMIDGKLTAMKPNILDQYYGAGNLYMTTYDMAHLVNNLKNNNIFSESVSIPLTQQLGTTAYPESYRYGFYVTPQYNRINGVFYGQIFTVYFNQHYVIVLASNIGDNSKVTNEKRISYIYHKILNQQSYYQ